MQRATERRAVGKFVSVLSAAQLLGVSRTTVYLWIVQRKLRHTLVADRVVLFRDSVEQLKVDRDAAVIAFRHRAPRRIGRDQKEDSMPKV